MLLTGYNPLLIPPIELSSVMKGKEHVQGCLSLRTTKKWIVSDGANQFEEAFACVSLSSLTHSQRVTLSALDQQLVPAQLYLEVCVKMQIRSLNSNEPCVFLPHQSQDYLPKSALSIISLATSTEVWSTKKNIVFPLSHQ